MKLVCAQSDLSTNLSLVSRAVPSRPTHPVLANVLLSADVETQRVQLTGFDLSLGLRTSFAASVEEGGEMTLPAKLLNDIVSRLPQGEITLAVEEAAGEGSDAGITATITSTSGRYKVRGMGVEEFPELPVVENGQAIYLPGEALIEGLRGSLFATSADETKQVLTGVHLKVGQDDLEFAATDGHRLAVVQTPKQGKVDEDSDQPETDNREFEMTVPARALRELERMVGMRQGSEPIALHFDQGQIVFELGDQRLTSRKLEGQYPAYRQLIPKNFSNQVNVDRRQLLSALERIAVLADQKNNIVKCTLDSENQQIFLSVEAADVGSGRESMPAQISADEPKEIAFNVKYLMDGLKVLSTSEIQIQLNLATNPVVLTPLGGMKMIYLVMPVQLRA
ncbi:DNA polymerase III subunit beta [Microcoleus sp. FACHB-672]|uniref:DNA polymerase III subunit beta n=1 Tax=Microcoleus sp. FACHB-672 TaxID=2692825 RepID=UPI0016851763|nr:DNA polymerase III subunit beta [Microcoleus sp. FACHB-672]MBD2042496.1 DNA polymerase III subunit beta [Microcoleus sp. FACHB-672]